MMKRLSVIIPLILVTFFALGAEDSTNEVFAPFVSRLSTSADEKQINLTWKNSQDIVGYKQIYRLTVEITESTIASATMIARVSPEVEGYVDTPPSTANFYYAVLIEDKNGELYKVFIPYRNKTSVAAHLETGGTTTTTVAVISELAATVSGETIIITFKTTDPSRELIMYRSTAPLKISTDLARASYHITLAAGTTKVTDIPVSGVDYYYAVVDSQEVVSQTVTFEPGRNATKDAVQIPLNPALTTETASSRNYPLPAPHILYNVETGEELLPPLPFLLPPTVSLTSTTAARVDSLLSRLTPARTEPNREILPVDEAPNAQGEDKELGTILSDTFLKDDYKQAADKLTAFLSNPHEKKVAARARFYLGQSFFFRGQYRDAAVQFVMAQDAYYVETQLWLAYCLERM